LRELYRMAYSFITLVYEDSGDTRRTNWHKQLIELEAKLARQDVLEARLPVLEEALEQLMPRRKAARGETTRSIELV